MTVSTIPLGLDELRHLVQVVLQGAKANERPDLVRRLTAAADVVAARHVGGADAASVATTVVQSLQSLEIDLRTQWAVLRDPCRRARIVAESRHAEARLRRFSERAAGWPRILGARLSAAGSDVESDLQSRLRSLVDEGTAAIELYRRRGDDIEGWLSERLASEVEACYRALQTAADVVAGRVATFLGLTVAAPPAEIAFLSPDDVVARLHRHPHGGSERHPMSARLLGVVMSTYCGMTVALVLPRIIELRLPMWLITVVAVLGSIAVGRAAVWRERQRQLNRHNAETAGHLRSTVEELRMALTSQLRDGVHVLEQQLCASMAEAVAQHAGQLSVAATASRRAAEETGRTDCAATAIESDLASVVELQFRARRVAQSAEAERVGAAG